MAAPAWALLAPQELATRSKRCAYVSACNASGKLVIVIEGASTGALLSQMDEIRNIAGVLNVEMVYQHAEEESVMKELLS